MQKNLYILRHAKTEIGSPQQEDHARHLIERGAKAAQIVGAYMYRQGMQPDMVLCSDAARTRETWEQIKCIYPVPLAVEFTRRLYLASANEMLQVLSALPDSVRSVLLIAHNPGVHQLCLKLAKDGDEDLLDTMHLKFPTCALASIRMEMVNWQEVDYARGTLVDFVTPKMLAGMQDD